MYVCMYVRMCVFMYCMHRWHGFKGDLGDWPPVENQVAENHLVLSKCCGIAKLSIFNTLTCIFIHILWHRDVTLFNNEVV